MEWGARKLSEVEREVTLSSNSGQSRALMKCTDWILKGKGLFQGEERAIQGVVKFVLNGQTPSLYLFLPATQKATGTPLSLPRYPGGSKAFELNTHTRKVGKARRLVLSLSALELSNWPLFVDPSRVGGTLRSPRGEGLRGVCGAARRGAVRCGAGRSTRPCPGSPRILAGCAPRLSAEPVAAAHLAWARGERGRRVAWLALCSAVEC